MSRKRNRKREEAFRLYKESQATLTSSEIAKMLNEKVKNIEYWRLKDKWSKRYNPSGGAPLGNKNALGHEGKAPVAKESPNWKTGFYSKHLPREVYDVFEDIENMSPIDILWNNIKLKYTSIVRAQKIMFVKDIDDKTKELKKSKSQRELVGEKGNKEILETYREEEYEIQQAWDKQANFLNAQSRAMAQLTNMIKKYDEMIHNNWEAITEEQKLRVEKLKIQISNPEFKHRKEIDEAKLNLDKDRFEHQKEMDKMKGW